MKKLTTKSIFFLSLSILTLFSCQKRQYGYFNNHYPQYSKSTVESNKVAKEKESTSIEASSETKEIQLNKTTTTNSVEKKNNSILNKTFQSNKPLTKQEKREIKKEFKKQLKQQAKHDYTGAMIVLLVILAIILPPLAVLLTDGLSGPFWLSILLTILFWIPGLIYALWRIFKD